MSGEGQKDEVEQACGIETRFVMTHHQDLYSFTSLSSFHSIKYYKTKQWPKLSHTPTQRILKAFAF